MLPRALVADAHTILSALIGARDPDDWRTVALALARGLPVWTQDKDHAAVGVAAYTTGELLDALREAGQLG